MVTGIRAAESAKRAGRRAIETCYQDKTKIYINPIITWSDDDVWEFITERRLPYCNLYDEGYKRLGCMFCPMAGKDRQRMSKRYPRFTNAFIRAFENLYRRRKVEGATSVDRWADGEEMFWWWINEDTPEDPDQGVLFE